MGQKVFVEKTEEVGALTVILDWSMAKYGVRVIERLAFSDKPRETDIYEFDREYDAQNAFDLVVETLERFL